MPIAVPIAVPSPLFTPAVLVVGAGPAGATAARALASAGIPVQLLDRSAFPRNKPCGGGISVRVTRRFAYLAEALPRIATHFVARLYLEGPDGESVVIESDTPAALMVRRVEFDALLVSLAMDAGARFSSGVDIVQASQDEHGVTLVSRDGRRFEAPIVIAADGVHSIVARRLGVNPGWPAAAVALDMMEETPRTMLRDVDPSTLWVAYGFAADAESAARPSRDGSVPEGYAYIFPKRDHVNIGIGYVLSYYREHVGARPYDLQRAFVDRLRSRGIVIGDSSRENFTPFLIPVGGPLESPGCGRVLLAGDAGGFVNGFTAEGIYYAMVSGDLAARAIIETISTAAHNAHREIRENGAPFADLASRYAAACDYEIGAELRDSILIQRYLFADRARIRDIVTGARRQKALTKLILDLAIGRRSYRDVRRRVLARAPSLAVRLGWQLLRKKVIVPWAAHS